jgi:YbgC/YbaW family acyl-CoA thioester hydrolase
MAKNITIHTVQWGDCDPIRFVFYPNYYRWMDEAAWALFAAHDLGPDALEKRYGVHGTPLVDTGCTFRSPARQGDPLTIESHVAKWSRRSFTIAHRFTCGERAVADGFETRIWGRRDPDHPEGIGASEIPEEAKALLGAPDNLDPDVS